MYVLDTNTLIYYFKGQGRVAQNLANVSAQEISVPTIVKSIASYPVLTQIIDCP